MPLSPTRAADRAKMLKTIDQIAKQYGYHTLRHQPMPDRPQVEHLTIVTARLLTCYVSFRGGQSPTKPGGRRTQGGLASSIDAMFGMSWYVGSASDALLSKVFLSAVGNGAVSTGQTRCVAVVKTFEALTEVLHKLLIMVADGTAFVEETNNDR